jgi:hypothetical protein
MMRRLFVVLLAVSGTGCATFRSMTAMEAAATRGVWVAKATSLFSLQLSDEDVLFCSASDIKKPVCIRATGNVHADVAIAKQ